MVVLLTIRADFLHFTPKCAEHSRYLPIPNHPKAQQRVTSKEMPPATGQGYLCFCLALSMSAKAATITARHD